MNHSSEAGRKRENTSAPTALTAASSYGIPVPSAQDSTPLAAEAAKHVSLLEKTKAITRFEPPAETRVFVVANQKGGVGKTTTTVNVAAAMALRGLRVLVVDLDPQGNTSTALNIPHTEGTPGVYEAIVDGTELEELVQPCPDVPGLTVLPASIDLAGAEIELVSLVARESRLDRALQNHIAQRAEAGDRIDYVFIDCPPSLGLLTVNAMVAGREVLIPIQCEYYALEGLGQLIRNIDLIRSHLNPKLEITTILLTMFDGRTRLSAGVADEVRGHFGDKVLPTAIPRSVRISEAPSYQQSVVTYDPTSSGSLSYFEAAREIAQIGSRSR
jgi:chromosome partitioning protein